jgi:hypothetical protein
VEAPATCQIRGGRSLDEGCGETVKGADGFEKSFGKGAHQDNFDLMAKSLNNRNECDRCANFKYRHYLFVPV